MEKTSFSHLRQEIPKGISSSHLNIGKVQIRMKNIFTFGQIMILVFGIVAISWAVGSEVGFVEAGVWYDIKINNKLATYKFLNSDKSGTNYYEKISDDEGPQSVGIGSNNEIYILGTDNEYRKSNQNFEIASIYDVNNNPQISSTSAASVPANNPKQYYGEENSRTITSGAGTISITSMSQISDLKTYAITNDDQLIEVTPSTSSTSIKTTVTPKQARAIFSGIPDQPTSQDDPYGLGIQFQGLGKGGTSPAQPASTETSLPWYESILGPSGSKTFTLAGEDYKGKNYYKDGNGDWIYTKDGTTAKVENDAELNLLKSNKGTAVGGAGFMEVGEYWVKAVGVAAAAKFATTEVAKGLGTTDAQAAALGEGIEKGIQAGALVNGMMKFYNKGYSGNAGTYVGLAVAAWYILNTYKNVDERSVSFDCSVWEAPKGGQNCEKCNNAIFGCSEYQCKSLGKGCELLNSGTEEELCAWVNRNDAQEPEIEAWNNALSEGYKYTPDNAQSPPDRGVIIHASDDTQGKQSCVPAYTRLKFGVQLDEPATCKIDIERKNSYEEMNYYFGSSSLARYNHSHTMSLPSINSNGTVIQSGGNMSLYVRCEDANGNSNTGEFVFKFCVEPEEDFTAPLIVETDPANNNPVAYNISKIGLTAYVNERAKCKWDFTDTSYELMNTTFNCLNNPQVRSAQTVFPCTTTLTGIKDRAENNYYIRCNDSNGNINKESHELILIGTQPLYIDSAKPNSTTVKGATSPVQINFEVKTSSGADDGNAYCYYKPIDSISYVQFLYNPIEMNYQHTQQLSLSDGSYVYSIKCVDAGGNSAFKEIEFDVETDTASPVIVRAYKEEGYLKLITDEESECVYNTQEDIGCRYEYEDGIEMQTVDEDEHFVEWNSQETFYIKCKDSFDNPPLYSDCSIIARPSEGQTL